MVVYLPPIKLTHKVPSHCPSALYYCGATLCILRKSFMGHEWVISNLKWALNTVGKSMYFWLAVLFPAAILEQSPNSH